METQWQWESVQRNYGKMLRRRLCIGYNIAHCGLPCNARENNAVLSPHDGLHVRLDTDSVLFSLCPGYFIAKLLLVRRLSNLQRLLIWPKAIETIHRGMVMFLIVHLHLCKQLTPILFPGH